MGKKTNRTGLGLYSEPRECNHYQSSSMILILSESAMSVIIPHSLQMAHSCAGRDYRKIVKCPENKIIVSCELTSGKESVNLPCPVKF